ncbi:GGDEF domain-containing protein [Pigmentiphaga sp.]|uniref:GGDEF domain-containing protein n=1 Tax=Pigmentiphaga sp. TaxID=1977564 RepID=UPI00128E6CFC|nr:GGDEF domain-containing protein [Pigmentiphaga sp.]MPS28432.1 GGDEF domain-containing protein [Alcaligenaceae bacterium SAGV5]MPS52097.1 GGDEF domain-containing protein [Alcaligenaceae bacterium SAGV3]MPT56253.1 GGDEF domain-containing protein [Alcaligenaceae bacterium]
MNDNETLLALAHPLIALLLAAMFYGAWRHAHRQAQFLFFSVAFSCYASGIFMQVLLWPPWRLANIGLTGVAYACAIFCFARGLAALEGRRLPWVPAVLVLAAMLAVRMASAHDETLFRLRVATTHVAAALVFLLALWQVRHLARGTALERLLFWCVAACTLSLFPRAMLATRPPDQYGYEHLLYWEVMQTSFYLFGIGVAFLMLILTSLRTIASLGQASRRDPLTGMNNRSGLDEFLAACLPRCARYGLIMVDVDHFKQINDRYGHPVGDMVLKRLATVMEQGIRTDDAVGRFGGEEFMVILPDASDDEAKQVAERLRAAAAAQDFSDVAPELRCTVSLGVGSFEQAIPFERAYSTVDERLARAKRLGRNRVVGKEPGWAVRRSSGA